LVDLKRIQSASTDVVRGINERIVLNPVRTLQPVSEGVGAGISINGKIPSGLSDMAVASVLQKDFREVRGAAI
jgi:hypothetical protein